MERRKAYSHVLINEQLSSIHHAIRVDGCIHLVSRTY